MKGFYNAGIRLFAGFFRAVYRIEVIGDKGTMLFSVFTYDPILVINEEGSRSIRIKNPEHVQLPLIKNVTEHLQGFGLCTCDSLSATPANWVMDRILWKL